MQKINCLKKSEWFSLFFYKKSVLIKNSAYLLIMFMFFAFACSEEVKDDKEKSGKKESIAKENIADKSSKNSSGYYGIETGIIEYEMKMMGMNTSMKTFFKDKGNVQSTDVKIKVMGQELSTKTLILNDLMYVFDVNAKTGTKTKINKEEAFDYKNADFENFSEEELAAHNIKKEGSEKVAGKQCNIFSINSQEGGNIKVWIWKNIPLKWKILESGMEIEMKAIKIEENPNFPDKIFEVPNNYNIEEVNFDDVNEQMKDAMGNN